MGWPDTMVISIAQILHTKSKKIKEEVTEKLEEPEDHEVCGRSCNRIQGSYTHDTSRTLLPKWS